MIVCGTLTVHVYLPSAQKPTQPLLSIHSLTPSPSRYLRPWCRLSRHPRPVRVGNHSSSHIIITVIIIIIITLSARNPIVPRGVGLLLLRSSRRNLRRKSRGHLCRRRGGLWWADAYDSWSAKVYHNSSRNNEKDQKGQGHRGGVNQHSQQAAH